jgi:uncharacterized membrane protein
MQEPTHWKAYVVLVEHDTLVRAFVGGTIAVVVASAVAVVILVRWMRSRRDARPVTWLVLLGAITVAVVSMTYLVAERAEKCDRTVNRTLCDSPAEWYRRLLR